MPGAAGRIDDRQAKQRFDGLFGVLRDGGRDGRIKSAVEQQLHEAVGRVVTTGGLACVALGLTAGREGELPTVLRDLRYELEQALVNAAEFLRTHIPPVHAREAAVLAQPR